MPDNAVWNGDLTGWVVGIGQAAVELSGVVPRYPQRESRVELLQYSKQGGGTMATALVAATALGAQARFVGKIGDDELGRYLIEGLREAGVDTSRTVIVSGAHSALCFRLLERETFARTSFYTRGDIGPLEAHEVDTVVLDDARVLLLDGSQPAAQIALAEAAQARQIPVLLDAGRLAEGMGELVALSDFILASERFLTEIAPRGEVEDGLSELLRMGPRIAVATLGESGSVGLEGHKIVRQGAHKVKTVDPTGAGDVYRGAFAYGLLHGWPLERCMKLGSVAAGLSCRELGGWAGIAGREEVLTVCGWGE